MTKYEWESELKWQIRRLPDEEIERVLDYYGELFADKIERGEREREIIAEFGNPAQAAYRILSEYDGEAGAYGSIPPPTRADRRRRDARESRGSNRCEAETPNRNREAREKDCGYCDESPKSCEPKPAESGGVHGGRLFVVILLSGLLGIAAVVATVIVWSVLIGLIAGGAACTVGGFAGLVPSAFMLTESIPIALVQFSTSLIVAAVGLLLVLVSVKLFGVGVRATKGLFRAIKNWVTKKKVTYES